MAHLDRSAWSFIGHYSLSRTTHRPPGSRVR